MKYQATYVNRMGALMTLTVGDSGFVSLRNSAGVQESLANVPFVAYGLGTAERSAVIRVAARKGISELRRVTGVDWRAA